MLHWTARALLLAVLGLAGACALALPAHAADEIAQAGRTVAEQWQGTMVNVAVVMKTRMVYEGEESVEEAKSETVGAVIDPSGLVAVSLATVNPNEAMEKMLDGEDMEGMSVSSEITDVKIRPVGGKDIPGKIVLRDKDLDLAFIRPLQPLATPLPALDLTKASTPQLFDQFLLLTRMGTVANRAIALSLDRVQSVVEKPRRLYVPGLSAMASGLGSFAFGLDGNPVGLLVLRTSPKGASNDSGIGSGMGASSTIFIILPAADIADAAKQAPAVADVKDEPKAEPKTEPKQDEKKR